MKATIFRFFAITFLFLIFLTPLRGQQKYNFEHISIPDGLSNATVWDILQDKYGFLWIATQDGLNRYDGYNFKIYKNDPGNPKSLANNFVQSLMIDSEGILWIGTNGGLCKYDSGNETFNNFLPDSSSLNASSNQILHIMQDSKNRIWVATADGLFKFDKTTQKLERAFIKNGNNQTPFTGQTWALLETSSGEIYSDYFYQGLTKYNESTNLFEAVNVSLSNPDLFKSIIIVSLYEDKTGKIWISSQKGFYNYDPHNGSFNEINLFKKVSDLNSVNANITTGIYQDNDGFLWINSGFKGMFRYNMKTGEVTLIDQSELPTSVHYSDGFFKFYKDQFGILWVTTLSNGLLKLDFQKEPFRLYPNPTDNANTNSGLFISSIYKSPADNNFVWLGTDDGLVKYDLKEKTFKKYKNQLGNIKSIQSNLVRSIQSGSIQDLWLATNKSLSLMNMSNFSFTNYDLTDKTKHYLVDYNNIYNLTLDDYGNLWTASGISGIVKFDTKNKTKQFIPTLDARTYDLKLIEFIDSLNMKGKQLAKLTEVGDYQNLKKEFKLDKQSEVMIVSVGEGLLPNGMLDYGWLLNTKSDTVWGQTNYYNSFYLSGDGKNRITAGIIKLDKGNYTLRYKSDDSHSYGKWNAAAPIDSTLWGIQVFDISGSDVNYYKSLFLASENSPYIQGASVRKVEYQNDGTVLIGTTTGLYKYDIRKNSVESIQEGTTTVFLPNLKNINDLLVDKNNLVWIATNGGLIKYNQSSKQFDILYDKDGLPSNYIEAIDEDTYGNLWLSTLNGISKFNKDVVHPIFINYDVKDGLQGYSFNARASFKSENGELFFAGQNGFNAFHSSNINKQLPIIDITQLKISNELVLPSTPNSPLTKSILDTKKLELSYSQNSISFEFSAIHFSRPDKNQYAYRLDGFDKKGWIYDNRRFATYTNLPPGDYIFRVIGSNGDGIWNETGASISIKVLPPWWRTIWAYIGYIFVFAGIIFGVDRFQRRRLLAKERTATQIREAELRAQIAEKESERKSYELEEARKLQLSMLPKEIPQLPHLNVAVYMKTATEVGGDYYDFHVHIDGTLTVVLGDATGHGMMSGMMVSIMKSLFMSDRTNKALKPFFENASASIKDMHLGRLMMALTCVQISNNKIVTTNAGMPPLFIYRKSSQTIEEVVINNMPLGALKEVAYDVKELKIDKGDTLLMMSDGFAELKNESKEIYGYRRARNSFEEVAMREPEGIVKYLTDAGKHWTNNNEPDDDVTFVVIKVK
jgi:serine phosphatase RsbU (regulator of sigma subunit)/ligand-binding sensor domain-containing protein